MADIIAQAIDEFKALGFWCVVHGPEIWLCVAALCVASAIFILGMWAAALLSANREDDDENKRGL